MRNRFGVFEAFKYAIYLLLAVNLLLFFQQEWLATAYTFSKGVEGTDILSGFAASIDTAAWLVLLILFELETSVLRDRRLTRRIARLMQLTTGVCYAFIATSFWGYASKVYLLSGFAPSPADACNLVGTAASLAVGLDDYISFDATHCLALAAGPLFKLPGLAIYATEQSVIEQLRLAWVDVANSAAWLGVVAVLAVDVFLQQRDRLAGRLLVISQALKAVLYGTLVLAAIYWGLEGGFVDVWDAVLWLVAFVFIELNLVEWNAEVGSGEGASSIQAA